MVGPEDQLKKFKDLVAHGDSVFSFEKIMPMPTTMIILSGSSENISAMAYLRTLESDANAEIDVRNMQSYPELFTPEYAVRLIKEIEEAKEKDGAHKSRGVIFDARTATETYQEYVDWGKVYVENYRKYGCTTWYDWCTNNWGTKWDACSADLTESGGSLNYSFKTAWSLPAGVIDVIPHLLTENKLAGIHIEWKWAEEQGYYGGIVNVDVDDVSDEFYEESDAAYELCREILGY